MIRIVKYWKVLLPFLSRHKTAAGVLIVAVGLVVAGRLYERDKIQKALTPYIKAIAREGGREGAKIVLVEYELIPASEIKDIDYVPMSHITFKPRPFLPIMYADDLRIGVGIRAVRVRPIGLDIMATHPAFQEFDKNLLAVGAGASYEITANWSLGAGAQWRFDDEWVLGGYAAWAF